MRFPTDWMEIYSETYTTHTMYTLLLQDLTSVNFTNKTAFAYCTNIPVQRNIVLRGNPYTWSVCWRECPQWCRLRRFDVLIYVYTWSSVILRYRCGACICRVCGSGCALYLLIWISMYTSISFGWLIMIWLSTQYLHIYVYTNKWTGKSNVPWASGTGQLCNLTCGHVFTQSVIYNHVQSWPCSAAHAKRTNRTSSETYKR